MSNSLSRPFALMFLLVLALPATVLAQNEAPAPAPKAKDKADLSGVVFDASGKPAVGYPMKMRTSDGDVIIKPTEAEGTFGVDGLPPGTYEFRVFDPGGNPDPIASKKVTLTAGQKEKIEIHIGSDKPEGAGASKPAAGMDPGTTGINWFAVSIPVLVLAAGIIVFFALRARRPGM